MTTVASSSAVLPPAPPIVGGGPSPVQSPMQVPMGGGAAGAPSPIQSPMQVPMPSAVQAASGGGQLVQPTTSYVAPVATNAAPTTTTPPVAGAQPAPPVAGGGGTDVASQLVPALTGVVSATTQLVNVMTAQAQAQAAAQAQAQAEAQAAAQAQAQQQAQAAQAQGGGPVDATQLVPVLTALVGTLTKLVEVLQGKLQAVGGAAAVQGGGANGAPTATAAQVSGDAINEEKKADGHEGHDHAAAAAAPAAPGGGALPPKETKDRGQIDPYIKQAAAAYGADADVLSNIAKLESNYRWDAVNDWDSNAKKGTPSKGMFQFIEPTFNSYAKDAKAANPKAWEGLGDLDWMDWRQQALTTAWAIQHGKGSAWATYKRAGG